jgi:RHS repeat-associated protein
VFLVHDTYGDPSQTSGTQQTIFGFTGEVRDDNQLLYLRARYYNPLLGQFFSLDPLEGMMEQPMSLNRYVYVQGNVANAVDPSGMIFERPEAWDSCGGALPLNLNVPIAGHGGGRYSPFVPSGGLTQQAKDPCKCRIGGPHYFDCLFGVSAWQCPEPTATYWWLPTPQPTPTPKACKVFIAAVSGHEGTAFPQAGFDGNCSPLNLKRLSVG